MEEPFLDEDSASDDLHLDLDGPMCSPPPGPDVDAANHQDSQDIEDADRFFMNNSLTIPGMQHIIHNMYKDVHEKLEGWDDFYVELKNLAGLLGVKERRQRFQFTCLDGTRFEAYSYLFDDFSASLYEARWGEVVKFMKETRKLVIVLRLAWDEQRYLDGVSINGEPTAAKLSAEAAGTAKFNPRMLTLMLNKGMHMVYGKQILALDAIPDKVCGWSETCVCHEGLLFGLSRRERMTLMRHHYGSGWNSCPLDGCKAPEMAAGLLQLIIGDLFKECEGLAVDYATVANIHLTDDDWKIITTAFQIARVYIVGVLQVKLDFWQRLPWLLCTQALLSESEARRFATRIIEDFAKDRRKDAHDVITWKWLGDDSPLKKSLQDFARGTTWEQLPANFHFERCKFRFTPTVETTMEAKHAAIAIPAATHSLKAVKVSLANRLPMAEQLLKTNKLDVLDLVVISKLHEISNGWCPF